MIGTLLLLQSVWLVCSAIIRFQSYHMNRKTILFSIFVGTVSCMD